jgi:SAM-dependent methyltransferase
VKRCLACERCFTGDEWTCPACGREPERRGACRLFAPELDSGGDHRDADYAFDAILEGESKHFWFRNRLSLVDWVLRGYLGRAESLLEVGCGTGFMLNGLRRSFPVLRLAATDALVASLVHAAGRLTGIPLYQVDARRIPFREEFDAVVAFDVIEHIDEDEAALQEMKAALRRGGLMVLTVPQHPWLWSTVDEWSHHRRRYTRRELVTKMKAAGLDVVCVTSFSSLLLPFLALSRLWPARGEYDPAAEIRIGVVANAFASAVSALERLLLRAGLRFPAGGSLLAVARRPG